MKITLLILAFICLSSCSNKTESIQTSGSKEIKAAAPDVDDRQVNKICYSNDSIVFCMYPDKKLQNMQYELTLKGNDKIFKNIGSLVLLKDEFGKQYVPEETFILDEHTGQEYICDSTYSGVSDDKYKLSFSTEKGSKKRLSLVIYQSKFNELKNGFFTLYKK